MGPSPSHWILTTVRCIGPVSMTRTSGVSPSLLQDHARSYSSLSAHHTHVPVGLHRPRPSAPDSSPILACRCVMPYPHRALGRDGKFDSTERALRHADRSRGIGDTMAQADAANT